MKGVHKLSELVYSAFVAGLFLEMTVPYNCVIVPRRAIIVAGMVTYTILVCNRGK